MDYFTTIYMIVWPLHHPKITMLPLFQSIESGDRSVDDGKDTTEFTNNTIIVVKKVLSTLCY